MFTNSINSNQISNQNFKARFNSGNLKTELVKSGICQNKKEARKLIGELRHEARKHGSIFNLIKAGVINHTLCSEAHPRYQTLDVAKFDSLGMNIQKKEISEAERIEYKFHGGRGPIQTYHRESMPFYCFMVDQAKTTPKKIKENFKEILNNFFKSEKTKK